MQNNKLLHIRPAIFVILFVVISYSFIGYIINAPLAIILPEHLWDYYLVDTINCFLAMIFFFIVYLGLERKQSPIYSATENKTNFAFMTFFSTVITLGMGGISNLWLEFASYNLSDSGIIAESLESFDASWTDIDESPYIFVFLSVVLLGPIVEELMFRGIIQRFWNKYVPFPIPILVSALAFGIWHMEPVQIVYTTIIGLMIGIVYAYTKNLFFPIYMHVLNNFFSSLPKPLQTDNIYAFLYYANYLMIFPSIFLCVYMGWCVWKRERT